MPSRPTLDDRYGASRPDRRRLLTGLVAVVVVGFTGWLAWATWSHATPEVASELIGFDVVDEHTASAFFSVNVEDRVEARCLVQALAADGTIVGEVSVTPQEGRNDVVLRTERRATTVTLVGCTTATQARPR